MSGFLNKFCIFVAAGLMWINYPQTAYSTGVASATSFSVDKLNTVEMLQFIKDVEPRIRYSKGQRRIDYRALYKCECGTKFVTNKNSVKNGYAKSCGCSHRKPLTHGLSNHRLSATYNDMKQRCYNPNYTKPYSYYGARGIKVYDGWINNFKAYYDYVTSLPNYGKDGLSLDRINNNGNYEPDNLRWATHSEQMKNRRKFKERVKS